MMVINLEKYVRNTYLVIPMKNIIGFVTLVYERLYILFMRKHWGGGGHKQEI